MNELQSSNSPFDETLPEEAANAPFEPVSRTMWGHFKYCMQHYADFTGRATRAEYWSFSAVLASLMLILAVVVFLPLLIFPRQSELLVVSLVLLYLLAILSFLVPSLAVTWRRLHDIGLSGAFFFVSWIPYVGGIVLLVMTLLDSRPGPNEFGPPTKYL